MKRHKEGMFPGFLVVALVIGLLVAGFVYQARSSISDSVDGWWYIHTPIPTSTPAPTP